jgi:hypothetical protein
MKENSVATSKAASDPRSVEELEKAVFAGDPGVTAEQLVLARAEADRRRIVAEGEAHRAHLAAEAARAAEIDRLKDDAEALVYDRAKLLALASEATDALLALCTAAKNRGEQLDRLAGRARQLGVAPMSLDDVPRDPSGLGWRRDLHMAGPAKLRLGDTALTAVEPRRLIARIVRDALDRAGQRSENFTLSNVGPPVEEQISATVREVTPPKLRKLKVLKRWGPRQPGDIVEVPTEDAKWALDRDFAEPFDGAAS